VPEKTRGGLLALRKGSLFGGVKLQRKDRRVGVRQPNGAVFTPGVELLREFQLPMEFLNFFESKKWPTNSVFCYANPQPRFNPLFEGKPKKNQAVEAFTNMRTPALRKKVTKLKTGPGTYHTTPLGYEELANIIQLMPVIRQMTS